MFSNLINTSICTLFEGNYHFGVAAFVNSLNKQGFTGNIYAGFRGNLPEWCSDAKENLSLSWDGAKTLNVDEKLRLHLLPLDTKYHFTNYKPDFMLNLMNGPAMQSKAMFYFDPDIIITAPWSCFETWVNCGIALSEDVNSPLAENHPRRIGWRDYFKHKGIDLNFKESLYANGGFLGVKAEDKEFLKLWKDIQEKMAPIIGGLSNSSLIGPTIPVEASGPFAPFGKTDQDALNASIEAWTGKISFVGKEAMGFAPGLVLMPHALGHPKPWNWRPLTQALKGRPPRLVDKEYWNVANTTISAHSATGVKYQRFAMLLAAFIGRFYKRDGYKGIY